MARLKRPLAPDFETDITSATREQLVAEVILLNRILRETINAALDEDCARCSHNEEGHPRKRVWYQILTDGSCSRTVAPHNLKRDTRPTYKLRGPNRPKDVPDEET